MALSIPATVAALLLAAGAVLAAGPSSGEAPGHSTVEGSRGSSAPEGARPASLTYRWPTGGPSDVARAFEAPGAPWARGHRGVDLRHAAGAPVVAAAHGVVAFAGNVAGRGVVSVRHADGMLTTYEPVTAVVRRGDPVVAGAPLGLLATAQSHCAPASCLHWGARRGRDDYVDPLRLLEQEAVIRLYADRSYPGR